MRRHCGQKVRKITILTFLIWTTDTRFVQLSLILKIIIDAVQYSFLTSDLPFTQDKFYF